MWKYTPKLLRATSTLLQSKQSSPTLFSRWSKEVLPQEWKRNRKQGVQDAFVMHYLAIEGCVKQNHDTYYSVRSILEETEISRYTYEEYSKLVTCRSLALGVKKIWRSEAAPWLLESLRAKASWNMHLGEVTSHQQEKCWQKILEPKNMPLVKKQESRANRKRMHLIICHHQKRSR